MIGIIGLYILGAVISPMEGDIWSVNNTYTIEWDNVPTVHVQLEMYNEYWKTDINGLNFLSTIADDFSYDWNVPIYLSQYWHYPKRIKLTDVEMVDNWYSGVFNTTGLSIDSLNLQDNELSLNWTTNLNNAKINIYLYDNETTYFNYNNRTPEYNLASNYEENIFTWSLPYGIDNSYVVIVETTDNLVMDISRSLLLSNVATTTATTTATSTVTTTATTTATSVLIPFIPPTGTSACAGYSCAGWIVLFCFIGLISILCIYCVISTSCFWCSIFKTANKVYPRCSNPHTSRSQNPIYISPKNRNTGAIANVVYNDNTYGEFSNTSDHYYEEPDEIEPSPPSTPPLEPFPISVYIGPPINDCSLNVPETEEDNGPLPPPRGGVYVEDDQEVEMVCLSRDRYSTYGVNSPPPPTCWERPVTPKKYTPKKYTSNV